MALPWHIPLEAAACFNKVPKIPEPTILKHYTNINIHDEPCEELQTGLMCDVTLNNKDPTTIQRLIAAGMTIARLNLREIEPAVCSQLIQSIRQAVYNYSAELEFVYPLAVVVDVKGPDIYTGNLKEGSNKNIELVEGTTVRLTNDVSWEQCGTPECLYIKYDHLRDLNVADVVWIDSVSTSKIKLIISEVGFDSIDCVVAIGGKIAARMTVRIHKVPRDLQTDADDKNSNLSCSTESSLDFELLEEQINWAVASDVDGVLVPDTKSRHDVRAVKDFISEKGKHILVFACIETVLGFDNIDEILNIADGIYLDKNILCLDLPIEKIFIAQKIILAKCSTLGKPCLAKAVINEQIPSLCVTDIATLALDGIDVLSLELHYDSPLKKLTSDVIRMAEHCLVAAAVICRQAERIVWQPQIYGNMELMQSPLSEPTKAICISAVELAMRAQATVMVCLTNSGRTAKLISQVRPPCPVIAVTRACHTARQLRFWRGVRAVHYFEVPKEKWSSEVESRIRCALDYSKAKRILRVGDPYVILTSTRRGVGYCDAVRLLYASSRETVIVDNLEM